LEDLGAHASSRAVLARDRPPEHERTADLAASPGISSFQGVASQQDRLLKERLEVQPSGCRFASIVCRVNSVG